MLSWSSTPGMGRTLLVLFLGQSVSFSVAMTNFSISLINKLGVDTPLSILLVSYVSLAVVYGIFMLYRRQKLSVPWYWYVFLGYADAQGNFLVVKSYDYTSITSVMVLLCFSILWAILLTWLLLGTKYSVWQLFGAGICVGGLGIVLIADSKPDVNGSTGTHPLFGDFLVILGTISMSIGNVGMEFCVKQKDRVEAMTMLGVFGTIFTGLGVLVFEMDRLESVSWTHQLGLLYMGILITGFVFYTIGPLVMKMSGATLFNLSILTSNMWAVLIKIFIYKEQVKWLFYPAYAFVAIGIIIYSASERRSEEIEKDEYGSLPDQENGSGDLLR